MALTKFIPGKGMLQLLNKESIKRKYNMNIEPTAFDRIQDASYPITFSTLHPPDDLVVRCRIVLNADGDTVMLDIPIDVFNALPETEVEIPKV